MCSIVVFTNKINNMCNENCYIYQIIYQIKKKYFAFISLVDSQYFFTMKNNIPFPVKRLIDISLPHLGKEKLPHFDSKMYFKCNEL